MSTDPRIEPVTPVPFRLSVDPIAESWSSEHIAKVMNVSKRTVQRWMTSGVDGWTGDRLAVKVAGTTGYNLWGHDFDLAFAEVDEELRLL